VADERTANDRDGSTPGVPSDYSAHPRTDGPGAKTALLHVCPRCDSELVYPVDWAPALRDAWSVELRCPDCEWSANGVYTQEVVDRFDNELDRGTEQLLGDLQLLTRANMEDQVERFIAALHADRILPEDF